MKKVTESLNVQDSTLLSILWRKVVIDAKLLRPMPRLLNIYIDKKTGNVDNSKLRASLKKTSEMNIESAEITWKTFIENLAIINPTSVKFEVHIAHQDAEYKVIQKIDVTKVKDEASKQLGVLWGKIATELKLATILREKLEKFLNNDVNKNLTRKKKANLKSTISDNIMKDKPKMTWKTFMGNVNLFEFESVLLILDMNLPTGKSYRVGTYYKESKKEEEVVNEPEKSS